MNFLVLLYIGISRYSYRGMGRDLAKYPKWVIALCVAAPFLLVIGMVSYHWFIGRFLKVRNFKFFRIGSYLKSLPIEAVEWLNRNFHWYKALSPALQKRVRKRMNHFMIEREFSGRGLTVTDEMKWCVAAIYAQLTIGMKHPWSKSFSRIVFYKGDKPADYSIPGVDDNWLFLDWDQIKSGFSESNDGVNEGLRVLAALLKKEDKSRKNGYESYPFFLLDRKASKQWNDVAKNEFQKFSALGLLQGRSIALEDFLSVTVVYFFEMPQQLNERHPELYQATVRLMRWDPIRKRIVN